MTVFFHASYGKCSYVSLSIFGVKQTVRKIEQLILCFLEIWDAWVP
jgi:hypothetical protein